jgi:hypothetical protein
MILPAALKEDICLHRQEELARLEDISVWEMEKGKGGKTYKYWMASWREGGRVRNVHLGSCRKVSRDQAIQKARKVKAEALVIK